MTRLKEIIDFLDTTLNIREYKDFGINGLQIGDLETNIESLAISVDSGLSIINKVNKNQLLIVHHGLFWGREISITGTHYKRVKHLIEKNSALAAYHLPLDGHQVFGNAAQVAQYLEIKNYEPGYYNQGMPIGIIAKNLSHDLDEINLKLEKISPNYNPLFLKFGNKKITSLGICTGSASDLIKEYPDLDLYISGEPKQSIYHYCNEEKVNASFIGHYNSEVFGVKAIAELLSQQFNLKYLFIDEPTGI